ncbi:MAG: molybdopterin-guanine dinucleotide biosynthesis protein B [Chloroflexi bacterium]|nr:molybdopterin-guanine dinucleotide biosynthesis protein B [Chloroflexota bacterium]
MIPVLSIVGKSNSGKTTLAERLVRELKRREYRIATVKHAAREMDIDKPGSDSSRMAEAGADAVWLSSPMGLFMRRAVERDLDLEDLPYWIGPGYDLILAEGFKEARVPKIEVHRKVIGGELVSSAAELVAVVTDEELDIGAPTFSWDETSELADFIEANFLAEPAAEAEVNLFVNRRPVPLNFFMISILNRTVDAILSTLKGIGEIRDVSLHIKKHAGKKRGE